MFYSIPFRILSIACSVCSVHFPLPNCPILLIMHVPVMVLAHLICIFWLCASMHSPVLPGCGKFILSICCTWYLLFMGKYWYFFKYDYFISLVNHFRLCYCHSDGTRQWVCVFICYVLTLQGKETKCVLCVLKPLLFHICYSLHVYFLFN